MGATLTNINKPTLGLVVAPALKQDRIAILDGYRALAILSVLAYHYTVRWASPHDATAHLPSGAIFNGFAPFEFGWLGVEFFFVISGFVISMTLIRCRSIVDFAVRRFARIWPPLLVAASLTSLIMAWIGPTDWKTNAYGYISSILMIGPDIISSLLHRPGIAWVDGVYWSLWVEVRFYVIAGLAYFLIRESLVSIWLVLQTLVILAWLLFHIVNFGFGRVALEQVFLLSYLPYFTLGICIYEIYSHGRARKLAMWGAAYAATALMAEAAFGVGLYQGKPVMGAIVCNLAILAMLYLFMIDHPVIGIFKSKPLVRMGQSSYSLYLVHQFIGVSIMRLAVNHGFPYLLVLPFTVVLMVSVALAFYRWIEVPAKSLILRQTADVALKIERLAPWLRYGSRAEANGIPS